MARASWWFVGVALAAAACAAGAVEDDSSLGSDGGSNAPASTATPADGAPGSDATSTPTGRDGAAPLSEDTGAPSGEDSATPGDDAGGDDAGEDSSQPGKDSGADSATPDAGHDSGSGVDAGHDSGTPPADSGTDAGTDSGSPTPDAAIDDAGCTPTSPTFTPTYFPPATTSGPCSSTQIQDFYNDCLAGSTSACNSWSSANASCNTCLQGTTAPAGPDWGPITIWPLASTETIVELNIGGCLVANGRSLSCAKAFEDLTECEHSACGSTCYGDSFGNYQTCQTAADNDSSQCQSYYNAVYVNTSPCSNSTFSSTCLNWTTFENGFLAIAGVMCD